MKGQSYNVLFLQRTLLVLQDHVPTLLRSARSNARGNEDHKQLGLVCHLGELLDLRMPWCATLAAADSALLCSTAQRALSLCEMLCSACMQ